MWGGGGVNLTLSTPSGAESKEVVSADFVGSKTSLIENTLSTCYKKTPADNSALSTLPMPSTDYIDLSKTVFVTADTAVSFTAPCNGYLWLAARSTAVGNYIGCHGSVFQGCEVWAHIANQALCCPILPLAKGQTIGDIRANYVPTENFSRFFKAVGEI